MPNKLINMTRRLPIILITIFAATSVAVASAPKPGQSQETHTPKPKPKPKPAPKPTPIPEIEMVWVDGGTFQMGSEGMFGMQNQKPSHKVTVSGFSIGKYEVTQKLWKAVMGSNPSIFQGDDLPVENVSWNDIQEFLRKLNQMTGKNYRLPTEAEWEFAARGGKHSRGYKYAGSNDIDAVAWYIKNSGNETHPVGTKFPNELGIYDMTGNVWECCQDWYDGSYYSHSPSTNPTGPTDGSERVNRGISIFGQEGVDCLAYRRDNKPYDRSSDLGFRLAL